MPVLGLKKPPYAGSDSRPPVLNGRMWNKKNGIVVGDTQVEMPTLKLAHTHALARLVMEPPMIPLVIMSGPAMVSGQLLSTL